MIKPICEVCDSGGETREAVGVAPAPTKQRGYRALCAMCFNDYNKKKEDIGQGKHMTANAWRRI